MSAVTRRHRRNWRSIRRCAAAAETRHRLHELIVRYVGECARRSRRIGSEAAELPIQSDLAQRRGADERIAGDVVDLERAGGDVAQDEIGCASCVNRGDPRELPIQTHGADEGSAGKLVVGDVVDFEPAGRGVAQKEIGLASNAAEIADAGELPVNTDRADEIERASRASGRSRHRQPQNDERPS
jgi:hypothetical protein